MKKLLLTLAAALLVGGAEADAQWGSGIYGFGYANNGFTAGTVVPPANLQDRIPHFSLYPPVYYSYPVPRPYGYSPFAYPGWTPTPHVEAMEPQLIVNPYLRLEEVKPADPKMPTMAPAAPAKPTTSTKQASVKRRGATATPAPRPLTIRNPYFHDVVAGSAH